MKNNTGKIKENKILDQCIKEFHSFIREKMILWIREVITILMSCEASKHTVFRLEKSKLS